MPKFASNVAPGKQEVQAVAVPSAQVAHEASHDAHVLFASAHLPSGQFIRQEPASEYLVPLDGQVRHDELVDPEHVSQEPWHEEQLACGPTISTNVPTLGHSAMQEPLKRNGADGCEQLRHALLAAPVHVPQLE